MRTSPMELTAKALRSQVAAALARVERGETVIVTYRGKPRARLVSVDQSAQMDGNEDPMPAFGMWRDRDNMADVEAYVREVRKDRTLVG